MEPQLKWHLENVADGMALVARSAAGICAVYLGDSEEQLMTELKRDFSGKNLEKELDYLPVLDSRGSPNEGVRLDLEGTEFQKKVWQALQSIPAGETRTYGEIASSIQSPGAARAVGQACGANKLAILIPCHRALPANGSLGGFRWGLSWKEWLLKNETLDRKQTA